MRYYEPARVERILGQILAEPSLAGGVRHHEVVPAKAADFVPIPSWLDPRITAGLASRGVHDLYTHQAEAIEAVRAGEDVVVVTPTASGKSLCYLLPVLQALAEDPTARALFLFPTKALGQDQVAELGDLSGASGLQINASTYDGDTPNPIRSSIRSAGQVVVTNPDMLHAAILPHHTKWFQLFEQLQVIVIDELHTYRGLFGSHVANVLRRLLRICAHYGSHPVIVCCSATIGNPAELAAALTGRRPRLVDRNGAPSGERHVLLVEPPLIDPATGARGSSQALATRWALPFLRAGRQTIVFGRSRVGSGTDALHAPGSAQIRGRPAFSGSRVPGRVPAHRAACGRARPPRRRGAGRRQHQCPGAGRGRGPARSLHPGRLSGLDRRHMAADGPGRPARGN